MDWTIDRATILRHCTVTRGNIKITDLNITDDGIADCYSRYIQPLGLEVWTKIKIQDFRGMLDYHLFPPVQSIHASGEEVEISGLYISWQCNPCLYAIGPGNQ